MRKYKLSYCPLLETKLRTVCILVQGIRQHVPILYLTKTGYPVAEVF